MANEGGALLVLVRNEELAQYDSADPNDPNKITIHHRKPRSIEGEDVDRNKSAVPQGKHQAWHMLYENWGVERIDRTFREDYEVFGADVLKTDLLKKLHEGYANETRHRISRSQAWTTLFAEMPLYEIIENINTVWLDPDYEIVIETVRVLTPRVAPRLTQPRAKRSENIPRGKITRPTHF